MSSKIKLKVNFWVNGVKRLNFKIGSKKFQMTILCHCVVIAIKIGGQCIGQVFSHIKSLKHKQYVPPDNTSKQSSSKRLILLVSQVVVEKNYKSLFHRCISHILLVKTNYLVSP